MFVLAVTWLKFGYGTGVSIVSRLETWEPHNFEISPVDSDCPAGFVIVVAMSPLQTRMVALESQREASLLMPPTSPFSVEPCSSSRRVAVEVSDGSVNSMDIGDAVPQVIILIEKFWGYSDCGDDDDFNTTASGKQETYYDDDAQQTSLPSEATIQVLKTFFDGIEDQMDVEDELLFGRPEDTSSVVSDLSQVTAESTVSASSSSTFQGWITSFLLDFDDNGNS